MYTLSQSEIQAAIKVMETLEKLDWDELPFDYILMALNNINDDLGSYNYHAKLQELSERCSYGRTAEIREAAELEMQELEKKYGHLYD